MIRYQKCGLDEIVIRLLRKLGPEFSLASMVESIEQKSLTVNKVFYDDKLYGILVLRAVINRRNQLVYVIEHAIAEDKIEVHFKNILVNSLADYLKEYGGEVIRIHTNRPGMTRIVEKIVGKPKEYVFQIGIDEWIHRAAQIQAKAHHLAQQMPV